MNATLTNPANLWQRVIDSHHQYSQAFSEFLTTADDKVQVLRKALRSKDRVLALQAIPSLSTGEKVELFPEWIDLARSAHSPFQAAWSVIESLPRAWILENIEKEVDPILRNDDETDYWMFLQLYALLDNDLMRKLAHRAAGHADAGIKELGQECLAKVKSVA